MLNSILNVCAGTSTGIPLDGYWTMETSHGVTPYFSDAGTDFLDAGVNPVLPGPCVLVGHSSLPHLLQVS
jgi:hypothetical protein